MRMQSVITAKTSLKITGGRTPHTVVEYERARQDLKACLTIDDAKYFADKADALAAWAKIYRDNGAARDAAALKLEAFRRMGELAKSLRPKGNTGRAGGGGARSLLVEHGLSKSAAHVAGVLARLPQDTFQGYIDRPKPPSPFVFNREGSDNSESFKAINNHGIREFRAWTRAHDAKQLARGLKADEAARIGEMVSEVIEWLDEFEQAIPKASV